MTAFELRRHLADQHRIDMTGRQFATLVYVHDNDHHAGADHVHDHDGEGDGA